MYNGSLIIKMTMLNDIAFVSIAFKNQRRGNGYIEQQDRLNKSLLKFYPQENIFMFGEGQVKTARPHHLSMYGFKPHAINEVREKGFKKICWMDTAMILLSPISYTIPMVAVKDDCNLTNFCSNNALKYFGIEREQLAGIPFVGGSFYYFDFNNDITCKIFNEWFEAEKQGLFGSQEEEAFNPGLQGHRHDETIIALLMNKYGVKPLTYDEAGYNSKQYPIMIKNHFEDKKIVEW